MSLELAHPNPSSDAITLKQVITLNQIQYRYSNAPHPALKNLSLTIPVRRTVDLVRATGSGKNTTVDWILGLLDAQQVMLEVDDQAMTEHSRRDLQRAIGYMPQQICLAVDTVATNITFSLDAKDIDQQAVERAPKILTRAVRWKGTDLATSNHPG